MKSKYGDPHPCSICMLLMSFGNALVCQRCLHYKNRFGEPRECQNCGQPSAFVKDEESRQKVNGQILCWVCTYNFKLARSREQSEHGSLRKKHSHGHQGRRTEKMYSAALFFICIILSRFRPEGSFAKRSRTMEEFSRNSSSLDDSLGHHVGGIPNTALGVGQIPAPVQAYNMDSVYNEHILTISRLQDEIKNLKKQLSQKSADMIAKDRVIADLKSDIFTKECAQRDKMSRIQHEMENETEKLSAFD
ncbi:unnamed protein product [Protopolystoma xenopodis]|uniref:Protein FAM76A n=1 Tax=Protopolystoma xenopodis TaxID=117903 RepID=A0A448WH50_9PLAT|nr:unnamed protein product [Protopolystoma xenopodis]